MDDRPTGILSKLFYLSPDGPDSLSWTVDNLRAGEDAEPRGAQLYKHFLASLGRYDSDRANRPDRLATVYGAMLAVDTRPQAETKNKYIAHWNAINKMIRESGKAVAQVRYSGHKILALKLGQGFAVEPAGQFGLGRDRFGLPNLFGLDRHSVAEFFREYLSGQRADLGQLPASVQVRFQVHFSTATTLARLLVCNGVVDLLDEQQRGSFLIKNWLGICEEIGKLSGPGWTAEAVLSTSRPVHVTAFDTAGTPEDTMVFCDFLDLQAMCMAYANAKGTRAGVDWPYIFRAKIGVFAGPRSLGEQQACLHGLFTLIGRGLAFENGAGWPLLVKSQTSESMVSHQGLMHPESLSKPPLFLDPIAFSPSQLCDFAVAHISCMYSPQEAAVLALHYQALLEGPLMSVGLNIPFEALAPLFYHSVNVDLV